MSCLGCHQCILMLPDISELFFFFFLLWYYDQRLIMQPAWIISVHLEESGLFETSSVLGLQGAAGSKNTISQVVSHELKISEHGFAVRLLQCPPQTHPHPPQTHPHYTAHTVSWQKAAFLTTWWRNLLDSKRERGGEKKSLPSDLDTDTWPTYPLTCPTHPQPWYDCHLRMFSQCFTIQFLWSVPQGSVN